MGGIKEGREMGGIKEGREEGRVKGGRVLQLHSGISHIKANKP